MQPDDTDDTEELPKADSGVEIEIPNSTMIWKVNPRPLETGDVRSIRIGFDLTLLFHFAVLSVYDICHVSK